jgi:chemotaxis protein CheC
VCSARSCAFPKLRLIESDDVVATVEGLVGPGTRLTAVRQAFTSAMRGEALVLYAKDSAANLGSALGYTLPLGQGDVEEIVLETSNILVGACIGGIAMQLDQRVLFSAPSFLGRNATADEIVALDRMTWEQALLVEIHFRLEEKDFVCHLLLFWPGESVDAVREAIRRVVRDA